MPHYLLTSLAKQLGALRLRAAFEEILSQFYAVDALLSPQGRFEGVDEDLDEGRGHVLIRANNFQYSAK